MQFKRLITKITLGVFISYFIMDSIVLGQIPDIYIVDKAGLAMVKKSLKNNNGRYKYAFNNLKKGLNEILLRELPSVMDKKNIPPSGDKHDYMSWGIYWWPDPQKADGLPYIRRDGKINPEIIDGRTDQRAACTMQKDLKKLALLYCLTENEKYAAKAAAIIKTWFLNPATRMNPNLNYAQGIPGRCSGRGIGIIDFSGSFHNIIDSIIMIKNSPCWTEEDNNKMRQWCGEYLKWLNTSVFGKKEALRTNNHVTWLNVQKAIIYLYLGNKKAARETVENAARRLLPKQFAKNGAQPLELKRATSLSYTIYNLHAWLNLVKIGQLSGFDLWNYSTPTGQSLKKGFYYLLPFAGNTKRWQYKQIKKVKDSHLIPLFLKAYNYTGEKRILEAIHKFKSDVLKRNRAYLEYPLKSK